MFLRAYGAYSSTIETSRRCEHAHQHADRPEDHVKEPSKDPQSPAQVDRLIAFLHSHFGTVEFLSAEDVNQAAAAQELPKDDEESSKDKEEEEKPDMMEEEEGKPEPEASKSQHAEIPGPVIRVRLDGHTADVSVENLVSPPYSGGRPVAGSTIANDVLSFLQSITSEHEPLHKRVESVVQVALRTITPLAPLKSRSSWTASKDGAKRVAIKTED